MSWVWSYFTKVDESNLVNCNFCNKNYKSSGTTSNLAAHLKSKHYHAFATSGEAKSKRSKSVALEKSSSSSIEKQPVASSFTSEDATVTIDLEKTTVSI